MTSSFLFAPLLPWPWLIAAALAAALALGLLYARRRRMPWGEIVAALALAPILLNPQRLNETRLPQKDQLLILTDASASQTLETRQEQLRAAEATLHEAAAALEGEIEPLFRTLPREEGSPLFTQLARAVEDVDATRLSAVILITDGQATEEAIPLSLPAPLHVLLTGDPNGFDRRVELRQAPVYGIVGKTVPLSFRVVDDGKTGAASASVSIHANGEEIAAREAAPGETVTLDLPVRHAGDIAVRIATAPLPGEVTPRNNAQAFLLRGVRERLRVLLVSGEANLGQRTWRNLLKSDPAVDLVHFTILRTPQSADATPPSEMSLIPFPVEELFNRKLASFDLIVFDRFGKNGLLPSRYLENIARHVQRKAGLLYVSAPALADAAPLMPFLRSQSGEAALAKLLPAQAADRVREGAFRPRVTPQGERHPVTAFLEGRESWGSWLGYLPVEGAPSGEALIATPDGAPLLLLTPSEGGRVAQFLSDQTWLWARGYEGGGPYLPLLRRLVHWLVREPELEEEQLTASVRVTPEGAFAVEVTRHTMKEALPLSVTLAAPDGATQPLALEHAGPGRGKATVTLTEPGLYRVSDETLARDVIVGDGAGREFVEVVATETKLAPLASAGKGSRHWLTDGVPEPRRVEAGSALSGHRWIGLPRKNAGVVTGVRSEAVIPPLAAALLAAAALAWAWLRERS